MNAGGTAALLAAIERRVPEAHLVLASSAAVYGDSPDPDPEQSGHRRPKPFTENDPVRPTSPYGASKAAAEVLAGETARRTGLQLTIVRLFNQFGPDQPPSQVPSEFAAGIAAAEAAGKQAVILQVGNPDVERDYTDTGDTARALRLVVERAATGLFNVCSGRSRSLREIIGSLSQLSRLDVGIGTAPGRSNRKDIASFAGSPTRLEEATGWAPQIPLEHSLAGLLDARRADVTGG